LATQARVTFDGPTFCFANSEFFSVLLEDVLALGDPDMYSAGNPVRATTTTLKQLQVFPQPVPKPHPQPWEPLTSARSLKFAAEHGINGVMIAEPNDRLRRNIEI
jgi:alkanesulfonate monooxygenase SsuD/methylene tetrahydromethanopterin reductase-like flavin-dependent oxidoreductase (luciferase family)